MKVGDLVPPSSNLPAGPTHAPPHGEWRGLGRLGIFGAAIVGAEVGLGGYGCVPPIGTCSGSALAGSAGNFLIEIAVAVFLVSLGFVLAGIYGPRAMRTSFEGAVLALGAVALFALGIVLIPAWPVTALWWLLGAEAASAGLLAAASFPPQPLRLVDSDGLEPSRDRARSGALVVAAVASVGGFGLAISHLVPNDPCTGACPAIMASSVAPLASGIGWPAALMAVAGVAFVSVRTFAPEERRRPLGRPMMLLGSALLLNAAAFVLIGWALIGSADPFGWFVDLAGYFGWLFLALAGFLGLAVAAVDRSPVGTLVVPTGRRPSALRTGAGGGSDSDGSPA